MIVGDEFHLPADAISFVNNKVYASKNELVKIVAIRDNVLIIERVDGFRFPISRDFLTVRDIGRGSKGCDQPKEVEEIPLLSKSESPMERRPKRSHFLKTNAAPGQTSLF